MASGEFVTTSCAFEGYLYMCTNLGNIYRMHHSAKGDALNDPRIEKVHQF